MFLQNNHGDLLYKIIMVIYLFYSFKNIVHTSESDLNNLKLLLITQCLFRVRDFWLEQGPAEVLSKLQRKELTLFRAAEMLNVTVTTLANYLSTLRQGDGASSDGEEEEESEHDRLASARQALSNNPDITIVKREREAPSVNGNK